MVRIRTERIVSTIKWLLLVYAYSEDVDRGGCWCSATYKVSSPSTLSCDCDVCVCVCGCVVHLRLFEAKRFRREEMERMPKEKREYAFLGIYRCSLASLARTTPYSSSTTISKVIWLDAVCIICADYSFLLIIIILIFDLRLQMWMATERCEWKIYAAMCRCMRASVFVCVRLRERLDGEWAWAWACLYAKAALNKNDSSDASEARISISTHKRRRSQKNKTI